MYEVLVQYYDESFERFFNVSTVIFYKDEIVIGSTVLSVKRIIDVNISYVSGDININVGAGATV